MDKRIRSYANRDCEKMEIKQCKHKCKDYLGDSLICNGFVTICSNYRFINELVIRLEITNNLIENYDKLIKRYDGLTENEDLEYLKLTFEYMEIQQKLKLHGVDIAT